MTPRGLTTPLLDEGGNSFTIEFDLVSHELLIRCESGGERSVKLCPHRR